MKKIGILTFHKSINYGSVLQAFALRKALDKLGYNTEVIDYQPDNYDYLYGLLRKPRSLYGVKYNLVNILHCRLLNNRKRLFAEFREKYLHLSSEKYRYGNDVSEIADIYDAVICGSDQIWNPKAKDSDINYYLPIPHKAKKISYAVSLNDGFAGEYKDPEKIKALLADFDYLSVRELPAKEELEKFIGEKDRVKVVIDPSLLLDPSDYDPICAERRVDKPYIFLYSVHHNPTTVRAAQILSQRLDMPVFFLYTDINSYKTEWKHKDFCCPKKNTSPKEFISFIKNASLVVTDSFHGTAFSVVFEKTFFSILKTDENGKSVRDKRIFDLLNRFDLTSRYISEEEAARVDLNEKIDYTSVNMKRKKSVSESVEYLKEAIG